MAWQVLRGSLTAIYGELRSSSSSRRLELRPHLSPGQEDAKGACAARACRGPSPTPACARREPSADLRPLLGSGHRVISCFRFQQICEHGWN